MDLYLDGIPLSSRSCWLEDAPEAGNALVPSLVVEMPHGRRGAMVVALGEPPVRKLQLKKAIVTASNTAAARKAAEDDLKDLLGPGLHTIRLEDDEALPREIDGYLEGAIAVEPVDHPLRAVKSAARATILCPEADWRAPQGTIIALPTAGARVALPLGTAPSTPLVRIMGAANFPMLRIRSADGVIQVQLEVTLNLTTDEWVDIDCHRGTIEKVSSGTRSNILGNITVSELNPATLRFPFSLEPAWGDWKNSVWPTAEVNPGTAEILFAKRYR